MPSSPGVTHTAYLMADLSIDLSQQAAISFEKEPARFRDVIFQSLKRAVDASKNTEITEENLQKSLIDALNESFHDAPVLRVVFTRISMG
ncbi:hypothetical protein [Desulfobotulus mexicanus]|uniref:Flagellar protein FliL n=1 Tax=Desulfobotulus mexicanus TaxID=2586642 RepID=A0A5Q4VDB2_9BACT|nr:hypothetical protein [Desulfobotulus mexicanus]TYT75694.1 hypothetical protein FIM25_01965 [Desulfobotulus mexicanus]